MYPAGSARGRLAAVTPCQGSGLKRGTATSGRSIATTHGYGSGRLCLEKLYHGRVPIGASRCPSSINGRAIDAHHPAQRRSALSALLGPRNPLPVAQCGGRPTIVNGVERRHREGASR